MASQGPLYPGTVDTVSTGSESNNDWLNAANVGSDNGSEAQITAATYDASDVSFRLRATGFGFTIPTAATIDGILVEIDRRCFAGAARDFRVSVTKDGTTPIGNLNLPGAWPSTSTVQSHGSSGYLWTTTWTAAEINASTFGVHLAVEATAANTDIGVDFIRVTVYYTEDTTINLTPTPVVVDLAVPAPTIGLGAVALSPSPVVLDLAVPAPTIGLTLALAATPVVLDLTVPAPTLGLGALELAPVAVLVDLGVPASTVEIVGGQIDLTPAPVLLTLAVPAPTLAQVLSLAPAPVALGIAVPAAQVGVGALTLLPSPIPLGLVVPGSSVGVADTVLSPSPVVLDLSISDSVISTALTITGDPVLVDLGVLGGLVQEAGVPIELASGTVVLDLGVLGAQLALQLDLSPGPVGLSLVTPVSLVTPGALALEPGPVSLGLRLGAFGQIGPYQFVTGSDLTLVQDMAAFWETYDAASSEEERQGLLRYWLLTHGGRVRVEDGFRVIKGGLFPVRVVP